MFIPVPQQRIVPGFGNKDAPICIIGEAPGAEEDRLLRPFVGPAGTVLESCLHAAGLTRSDCYVTNTIKVRPRNNEIEPFYNSKTGRFTADGQYWIDELEAELTGIRSNILVPMGNVAMAAVTGLKNTRKDNFRGYVTPSLPRFGSRKCIPTIHPAASLRGQYILRYYITADLKKIKAESAFPEIRRPKRNIIIPTTLTECLEWVNYLLEQPEWVCDIEVMNFQVSAIGFAPAPDVCISFPMSGSHWTELEEIVIWTYMNKLLTSNARKIFQNGIFDVHFLAMQCGIHVQPPIEDTMIAHHVMYPDMLKGLGFLGSLYCGSQEYWKNAVKWENIKEES